MCEVEFFWEIFKMYESTFLDRSLFILSANDHLVDLEFPNNFKVLLTNPELYAMVLISASRLLLEPL